MNWGEDERGEDTAELLPKRSQTGTVQRLLLLACAIVFLHATQSAHSQIYLSGNVGYTLQPPVATLSVDRIYNDYWWTSGTLKLELWATALPFTPGSSGYKLAQSTLGQLNGYYYYNNVSRTDGSAKYPGAPGVYYLTMVLLEYETSGYVIVDYLQFSGTASFLPPTVTSSGSASGKVGQSFSYQITGTQSPTGYGASGLPPGLSVNPSTGSVSGTPTTAGTYNSVISAANYWGTGTENLTITIAPNITPPSILWGPQSITRDYGSIVTFGVSASGTLPLSYQWRKNGVDIPSSTNSVYKIRYAASADAASYSVRVSNSAGSATSSAAILTVNDPVAPSFDMQPQDLSAPEGSTVFLLTAASGTGPLRFQWWKGTYPISGATNPVYSITGLVDTHAGQYRVTVSNLVNVVTSQWATVVIDRQAIARTAAVKAWTRSIILGDLTWPWQVDNQNYGNLFNVFATYDGLGTFPLNQLADNPSLPFNMELRPKTGMPNGYEADFVTYSDYLTEFIDWGWVNGTITSLDSDGNDLPDVCQSEIAVNVSVSATSHSDTDGDINVYNGTMTRAAGTQFGSYSVTEASSGITLTSVWAVVKMTGVVNYSRGVTNSIRLNLISDDGAGNLASSFAATTFNVVSANQFSLPSFVLSGESNKSTTILGPVVFNRTGSRYIGNLNVVDGNSLTPWPDFTQWVVEIVDDNDLDSDGIPDLTDGLPPSILAHPQSVVVNVDGNVELSVEVVGPGILAYQWRKDGVDIPGATGSSWSIINAKADDAGTYTVRVSNSAGSVTSLDGTLTVIALPVIASDPDDARRIAGTDLLLSVGATGASPLAYQWWFNGSLVPSGGAATLTLNNITVGQSGDYWCIVSNAGGAVTSRVAKVTVGTALLSAVTVPDIQTVRTNGFQLALEMELGRSYRIEGSTDLTNWVTITNFVSSSETMQFLDRAATNLTRRFYRVIQQ